MSGTKYSEKATPPMNQKETDGTSNARRLFPTIIGVGAPFAAVDKIMEQAAF